MGNLTLNQKIKNCYYSIKSTHEFIEATQGEHHNSAILGFTTSTKTRPLIVAKFEEYIRNKLTGILNVFRLI